MTQAKPEHTFAIAGRDIGPDTPPYLIAEMSGNHNHDIDRAIAIIDAAADSGADAVKLQTYTADTMTLDIDTPDFRIEDEKSLWNGRNLYDLYTEAHTPWDWHGPLFEHAKAAASTSSRPPSTRPRSTFSRIWALQPTRSPASK